MNLQVIDTNVLAVANGRHPEANVQCLSNCVNYLKEVKQSGNVLIDDEYRILNEYKDNLRCGGQPRSGWQFYKWLRDHPRSGHCKQVHITKLPGDIENYKEYPCNEKFNTFDPSDRKFVAVAISSQSEADIANAVDSDWISIRDFFINTSIHIKFICSG